MGGRVNTAIWVEASHRWRVDVQKDGVRRSFYCSKPGRNGQREANRKADAWLDDGIEDQRLKVSAVYPRFLEEKQQTTSRSNWAPMVSRWKNHISPVIGRKPVSALTEQDLQDTLNRAFARSKLSRKTLMCLRADLCGVSEILSKSPAVSTEPGVSDHSHSSGPPGKRPYYSRGTLWCCSTVIDRVPGGKVVQDDMIHAYRLAVLTGVRPGELRGLRWRE